MQSISSTTYCASPIPNDIGRLTIFLVLAVCAIAPVCQGACICKIKAHQDLCAIPEPLAKYHATGNATADTAANAARATGFLDSTELISDLQASAAVTRTKTRMTMQFCAQATLAFLRHSKDKEDSQHLNAQPSRCRLGMRITSTQAQALLWSCDPACRKLDIPLLPHSESEFAFWGFSYVSLLRNWLAALQWPSESQGDGSPDITWFELYLDFRISTQRNVPWNQGGTCDAPRYAMDPQPGYEIVPQPPLQQTLRNFASSVSHLATHLESRVLPSRDATRSPELLLLRRLRVFLVGLSWCVLLRFKPLFHFMHVAMFPSVDTSLSVLIQTFHLSHLVSRFLRSLWMYSFRLLVNVPLRLVSVVGLGQCELRFGAPVLFSACAPLCFVHFSPRANSAQARCSNMRPASLGVWSLRKVPRKVPLSRTTCPSRSVSRKRMCLRVMGPLTFGPQRCLVPLVVVGLLALRVHPQVLLYVLLDGDPAVVYVHAGTEYIDFLKDATGLTETSIGAPAAVARTRPAPGPRQPHLGFFRAENQLRQCCYSHGIADCGIFWRNWKLGANPTSVWSEVGIPISVWSEVGIPTSVWSGRI